MKTRVVLLFICMLFCGCGGGDSAGFPAAAPGATWSVQLNALNLQAETRTWGICGGQVLCTFVYETPPDKPFSGGGFLGSATAAQAECYREHGTFITLEETEEKCQ